jgi:hypothetical protein
MRPAWALVAVGILVAGVAACDGSPEEQTGSADIEGEWSESGNDVFSAEFEQGHASINTPVFQAKVKLPKMNLGSDKFELDGVHLYPGSTIQRMNVRADKGANRNATVEVAFTSPGEPAKVRDWFVGQFEKASRDVETSGNTVRGTTKDGEPFEIALAEAEGGSTGTIRIIDTN